MTDWREGALAHLVKSHMNTAHIRTVGSRLSNIDYSLLLLALTIRLSSPLMPGPSVIDSEYAYDSRPDMSVRPGGMAFSIIYRVVT